MIAARRLAGLDLRDHAPGGGLADQERALEIDPQHAVEIRFRQVEEVGAVDNAGIVDKDVEPPRSRQVSATGWLVGRIAHVAADEAGIAEAAHRGLPASTSTSAMATRAPSATKRRAIGEPMPFAPPVTIATLF